MKKIRLTLALLIILVLTCGCACNKKKDAPANPAPTTDETKALNAQNNTFAFDLYGKADKPGKNLFFSPYSISSALSMVWGGAKGNTAAEMAKALNFTQGQAAQHAAYKELLAALNGIGDKGKAELSVANALFGAKKYEDLLLPDYLKLLRENYSSDLYSLDFSNPQGSADFINNWVEKKTKERIKNLVNEDHIKQSNDGLVVVNAIYFKGNWQTQFDPKATKKDDFYTSAQERIPANARPVEMMHLQSDFPYAQLPGMQVLELPYAEKDLAMLVVLPDKIDPLKTTLNADTFSEWQDALSTREVKVFLPKFTLDLTLEGLSGMLKALGIKDAFDANLADFTGIREPGKADLYIMDVLHKAFVEVKEEGTEAAAATAVVMATKAAPGPGPEIPVFRADHPFLYFIVHKPSNTILFMGKLAEPPKLK